MTRVGFFQDSVGGYLAQSRQTKGPGPWTGDPRSRAMRLGYRPFSVGGVDLFGISFVWGSEWVGYDMAILNSAKSVRLNEGGNPSQRVILVQSTFI